MSFTALGIAGAMTHNPSTTPVPRVTCEKSHSSTECTPPMVMA